MAKPILEINIDDEKFKNFLNLFNKYKSELARMPEIWKDTNEEIVAQISSANTVVEAIDKQTRALIRQSKVFHEETKELEKQSKLEEKMERAEDKARRDQQRANKKAVDDTKKIASNIANATVNIVKWGALDFVVGGALDLYGIGSIAKSASDQLTAARGFGVSIGQRQALIQTFQPIFDASTALENAAEAQTDITKSIPYRILGLNPEATNPAELSIEAAIAAKRRLQNVPQQNQLLTARALGLDKIFSPDELRRIINTPISFLEEEKTRYEKLQKVLDIPPQTAQAYTKLSQDLSIAGRDIEVYFANKLIALGPGLDDLIHEFEGFAKHLIDLIDWKNLGQDVKNFATKTEEFVNNIDWNRIKNDLLGMAIGVERVLQFFHLIPEPNYKPGSPEYNAQKEKDALLNAIVAASQAAAATFIPGANSLALNVPGALANTATDLGDIGTINPNLPEKSEMEKAKYAFQYFRKMGFPMAAASGMVASIIEESDLNPFAKGDYVNGIPTGLGLGGGHKQWIQDYAKLFPGHHITENTPGEFERQLQLFAYEMKHDKIFSSHLKDVLASDTNPEQAGYLIRKYLERPLQLEHGSREAGALSKKLSQVFVKTQVVVTAPPGHNASSQTAQVGRTG